ncbi:hypothetical protein AMTRI_Chr12g240570 [Amborella trichopoda]
MRRWSRLEEDRLVELIRLCGGGHCQRQLKQIHAYLLVNGQSQNNFLLTKLIRTLVSARCLGYAHSILDSVSNPNAFLWTAMIRAYSQTHDHAQAEQALLLYTQMQKQATPPLTFTLSSTLKVCARLAFLHTGKHLHTHVIVHGLHSDTFVQTTLVDMYAACGNTADAQLLFDRMSIKDIQAWNTMIAGYARSGDLTSALSLFHQMPEQNAHSRVEIVMGYAKVGNMEPARRLFESLAHRDRSILLYTAMIVGYAKCGDIKIARSMFDDMVERDVPSWNAMIAVYAQNGRSHEALDLFRLMLQEGGGYQKQLRPNQATMASVISACAQSGAPGLAKWVGDFLSKTGMQLDARAMTALIDMHAKCGNLDEAQKVFRELKERDVVSYSAMISGFAIHGRALEAIQLFSEMLSQSSLGLKPDGVSFIGVLTACSHAGLVEDGYRYFELMCQEYSIPPTPDHYTCMVDLLGRAGRIEDAYKFIQKGITVMGGKIGDHAGVWGALLSACRLMHDVNNSHNDYLVQIAETAAYHLFELESENAANFVMLSDIYAKAKMWEEVGKVREMMRRKGIRKAPGCSWTESEDGVVHKFTTGDTSHPLSNVIHESLGKLMQELKDKEGFVPKIELVLHDVSDLEKEQLLMCHSEKLAIVFGLITSDHNTPIQVMKNLRVCEDCHSAIKKISKIKRREILLRDNIRYHHFKDGTCSCGDYW